MHDYWLPPELTAQVISYFIASAPVNLGLARYATVNRQWQTIIERYTFSSILVDASQRLEEFDQIVARNGRRRSYIRDINLAVELESYDIKARTEFETAEENSRNNKIFEETIQSLFRILEPWPEDPVGIRLSLEAHSPSDAFGGKSRERWRKGSRDPHDLLERRYEKHYLQFPEGSLDKLPTVRTITTLFVKGGGGYRSNYCRLIQPASCAIIASRLPLLHTIDFNLADNEKRDKSLRKRNRDEFAHYFDLWPSSVKHFSLNFFSQPPRNQNYSPQNLVGMNIEDPLCASLRQFSQRLTAIALENLTVGKELFWPVNTKDELPFWPNLTTFYLEYTMVTPSGKWLFERNPEENEDEWQIDHSEDERQYMHMPSHLLPPVEDQFSEPFRTKVSSELINDFYMSAGRAAQRMPKLRYIEIEIMWGRTQHSFKYTTNGETATATWADLIVFRPEERVLQVWRDVARQHTGLDSNLDVKIDDLNISEPGIRWT